MSNIPQNRSDEKELIDCVQRFLFTHHVGKLLAKCKKKVFHLFLCSVINSATFLLEEACICNNELAPLRKIFLRILFTVSLIRQKQTGSVLLLSSLLIS